MMAEIIHISKEELRDRINSSLAELEQSDWRSWVADCCLHCSDAPTPQLMRELEDLDTAAWLLSGESWRDYL